MNSSRRHLVPFLWPVGFGGLIAPERVIAAGRWDSAPIKRAVRQAQAAGKLIDLTYGRACQWVVFLDSNHLILTAVPMPVAILDDSGNDESLLRRFGEQ